MPEFTFHHGGVSVPSLDEAIAWYGRVLGFAEEKRFTIAPARAHAAMIRKGALRFELFEPEDGNPLPEGRSHPPSDRPSGKACTSMPARLILSGVAMFASGRATKLAQ